MIRLLARIGQLTASPTGLRARADAGPGLAILAAVLLGISACGDGAGDGSEAAEGWSVRDSAGIQIVTSRRPVAEPRRVWRVDPEPRLELGREGSDLLFGSVAGVAVGPGGRMAVSDYQSHEVPIVDSSGTLLHTVGREGKGPGEFQMRPVIAWSGGDTMLVTWDPRSVRLSRFDGEGALVHERELATLLQGVITVNGAWEVRGSGALLGNIRDIDEGTSRVLSVPADADRIVEFGRHEGDAPIVAGAWLVTSSFAHSPVHQLSKDESQAFVARTEAWEIERFDSRSGALKALIRVVLPRSPVTEPMIQEERDEWAERGGGRFPARTYHDALDRFDVPDSLPAIRDMHVDPDGNLWVGRRATRRNSPPTHYVVLDPTGRWIADVELPEGLGGILDITRDAIVFRAQGPLGESMVHVHAVRR